MYTYYRPSWSRFFPESAGASIAVACVLSGGIGILSVTLAVHVLRDYGWALFLGVPMLMGVLAPTLHGIGARRHYFGLLLASLLAQLSLFAGMLVFGIEGIVCVVMAAPLWMGVATVGTSIAYPIHVAMWQKHISMRGFPVMGIVLGCIVPLWMGAEHVSAPTPDIWAITTSVEVAAPPEVVWKSVIAFPELPPPTEALFRLGVAYPLHAHIAGHGPGATRFCVFSTGAFVEPITVWNENKLLAFDVAESPPSMREWNPFWNIHPAHLEGYLVSKRGQFELIDLGNGHTRLIGTTWYQNKMYPAAYWRLWSDMIIHRIHIHVLTHIRTISETATLTGDSYDHS